jgi:hypothetical protein
MSTTNAINAVPHIPDSRTIVVKPEELFELKTFDDVVEFAKSRRRFSRHDIQQHCYGKRLQRLLQRALQYNVIKEVEYHDYEYNQDMLSSYEQFTGWLRKVDRFALEDVPGLERYKWTLQAKRDGLIRQLNWWTWETVSQA